MRGARPDRRHGPDSSFGPTHLAGQHGPPSAHDLSRPLLGGPHVTGREPARPAEGRIGGQPNTVHAAKRRARGSMGDRGPRRECGIGVEPGGFRTRGPSTDRNGRRSGRGNLLDRFNCRRGDGQRHGTSGQGTARGRTVQRYLRDRSGALTRIPSGMAITAGQAVADRLWTAMGTRTTR